MTESDGSAFLIHLTAEMLANGNELIVIVSIYACISHPPRQLLTTWKAWEGVQMHTHAAKKTSFLQEVVIRLLHACIYWVIMMVGCNLIPCSVWPVTAWWFYWPLIRQSLCLVCDCLLISKRIRHWHYDFSLPLDSAEISEFRSMHDWVSAKS